MGFLIGIIVTLYFNAKSEKKSFNLLNIIKDDFLPLYGALTGLVMPINVNLLFFVIINVIILVLYKYLIKLKGLNIIAFVRILISLIYLKNTSIYFNTLEASRSFSYSLWDMISGHAAVSLAACNILLILILFLYLALIYIVGCLFSKQYAKSSKAYFNYLIYD